MKFVIFWRPTMVGRAPMTFWPGLRYFLYYIHLVLIQFNFDFLFILVFTLRNHLCFAQFWSICANFVQIRNGFWEMNSLNSSNPKFRKICLLFPNIFYVLVCFIYKCFNIFAGNLNLTIFKIWKLFNKFLIYSLINFIEILLNP